MADAESFTIPIEAQASGVDEAADSVDSLSSALDSVDSASSAMSSSIDDAGSAASSAASDVDELSDSLEELESTAGDASDALGEVGEASSLADVNAGEMSGAMNDLGGPLGAVGGKAFKAADAMKKVAASLGPMGAAAVVATVAIVALAAAFAVAIIKMAKFAVESNKKAMDRLGAATDKTKKNLAALFKDVKVEGFVDAFEDVVSIFEEGSNESKALKLLVETLLNPLFDAAKVVGPFVKEMFRGMIWAALQAAIVVAKLRIVVLKAIPKETRADIRELASQIDGMKVAFYGGAIAIGVITVALAILSAVVVVLAVILGAVLLTAVIIVAFPFILLALAVAAVIAILYVLYVAITAAIDYLGELASAGYEAATAMVDGLVEGIKSGASEFVDAVTAMATEAINAVKSVLGISSPSTVFASIGMDTAKGAEEGIEEGSTGVQSSLESMLSPEDLDGPAGGSQTTTTNAGVTFTIENLTIHAASDKAEDIKDAVVTTLENFALQLGGGEVPA